MCVIWGVERKKWGVNSLFLITLPTIVFVGNVVGKFSDCYTVGTIGR